MDRSRVGRVLVGLGLAGLVGAGLAAPDRVARWLQDVPEPVLVGGALLLAVVLWFLVVRYALRLCYRLWRAISERVYWVLTLVLPESPLVKFAAGAMVMIAAVIVIVGVLPAVFGTISGPAGGPESYADRLGDDELNSDWGAIVEGDAVAGEPGCGEAGVSGAADRDGDGLPDAWERAGETPDGAALPGASPDRTDLYVQVNYGADVEPLSETEKAQLRAVWAAMPVDNPDGSTGIALHLDDASAGAGGLGEAAEFTSREGHDRYYTTRWMGARRCVYRQVVYGKLRMGRLSGVASLPGYATAVDGSRQPGYDGDVAFRVAMTTHQLLHTVTGRVNGRVHTDGGWLRGGPRNEFLSDATARALSEDGLFGPAS